jgi:lysophospholipase L1-like esterase
MDRALIQPGTGGALAASPSSTSSARVLLIGDSFAEGFGPALAELAAKVGLPFKGRGVRSTTVRHWLSGTALVNAMTGIDPTLTLVSLGANDMGASDAAAEGRRAGQLIDALRRNGSAAVVWIAPPLMPNDKATFRTQLAAECARRDVRVFDTPALSLERAPHDFHMTPKGYRTWAEAIAAWVPFAGLASGVLPPDVSQRAPAANERRPPAEPPAPVALEDATPAPAAAVRVPDAIVVEGMGQLPMEEYVARVVTGEIGLTREPQALAALAVAARTYAVWMMQHEHLGSVDRPMPNSERKQVAARVALQRAADAARATRGGIILRRGRVVLASYVAGAIWPLGASHGRLGRDEKRTERFVTYNDGLVGEAVHRSPIASMTLEDNRGCLSQNGAIALAQRGFVWPEILRYFYGRDLDFTCAEPASRLGPRTPPTSPAAPSAAALAASGDESLVLLAVGLAVSRALG